MSTILSLSGGLDSATLLSKIVKEYKGRVTCVNFYYGSKHGIREGLAAEKLSDYYGVELIKIDICNLFRSQYLKSSLMKDGVTIPEGHYNEPSMKLTVVPGRNTIMTSILAGIAESLDYDNIALAIHQGDHFIYPDCRPEWFFAMRSVVSCSTEFRVTLIAPFLESTKSDIVAEGLKLNTPYSLTYTCYKGLPKPCGKCGSCRERLEAFELNNTKDPIDYE